MPASFTTLRQVLRSLPTTAVNGVPVRVDVTLTFQNGSQRQRRFNYVVAQPITVELAQWWVIPKSEYTTLKPSVVPKPVQTDDAPVIVEAAGVPEQTAARVPSNSSAPISGPKPVPA